MRLDNPDRYILRNTYLMAKPGGNGTDPVESMFFVINGPPFSIISHSPVRMLKSSVSTDVCKRLIRDVWTDFKTAKCKVGDEFAGFLCVGGLGDGESHVRLAGCQPNFSNENIFEDDGCADGSHFQLLTFGIGYHGIESDHPPASLVGGSTFLLARKFNRYLYFRFGPSPDGNGHIPLQYGIIGKDFGKTQFGTEGAAN